MQRLLFALKNKGIVAMNDITIGLDQNGEELFICEFADEALETAARSTTESYFTLAQCTALTVCPGPQPSDNPLS